MFRSAASKRASWIDLWILAKPTRNSTTVLAPSGLIGAEILDFSKVDLLSRRSELVVFLPIATYGLKL
jgi:hypothetical protein